MIFSDLSFLLIPDVALEADDITKQVNQIMGGKKAPAEVKSDNQRDEDLTKTDNLFDNINKNYHLKSKRRFQKDPCTWFTKNN